MSWQVCHLLNTNDLVRELRCPKTHTKCFSPKKIFERRNAIRKREHFIGLWLDDKEYSHLQKQCEISGLTASAHIRKIIMGEQLRPRPPDTYAKLLRELSAIGNNINQIAYWANAQRSILEPEIVDAVVLAKEAYNLVKEAF